MVSLYAQLFLLATLPALFALGGAALGWQSVARPWLYLLTALVVLYVFYAAVMYFLDPALGRGVGYVVSASPSPQAGDEKYILQNTRGEELEYFLSEYAKRMVVFAVLAVPTLFGLFKLFRR